MLTDIELKNLLLRMIHSNYKIRPSAKEVLDSPTIHDQVNKRKDNRYEFSFILYRFAIWHHHLHLINIDMNM